MNEGAPRQLPARTGAVFGRYVLVERIGSGAMGEVWVAIDPDLDRKIALKLLRSDRLRFRHYRRRLLAEARAMAKLRHPNVVSVHDVGEVDGQLFVAMEFVAGDTLAEWISAGPHPWQSVLAVMRQAGAGLTAAHEAGLIHRDFKPANVIIGSDARVRVLDFGLAQPDRESHGAGALASDSMVSGSSSVSGISGSSGISGVSGESSGLRRRSVQGTPAYMAPEQHRGHPAGPRSDLFAFCVTLFEALYGERPFAGEQRLAVAMAILGGQVRPIAKEQQAPAWVHRAVLRGLSVAPERRPADMRALLRELERSPRERRLRWLGGALALTTAVAAAALAVALDGHDDDDGCAQAGTAIAAVWDESRRQTLVDAVAVGEAKRWPGPAAAQRGEGLDRVAREWDGAQRQLCRDRKAERVTDRLHQLRADCLTAQLAGLETLAGFGGDQLEIQPESPPSVEAQVQPEALAKLRARPFAALRSLGRPAECLDLDLAGETQQHPPLAAQRTLRRSELLLALRLAEASSAVDELAALAEREGADPATIAWLRGRAALDRGDLELARRQLHRAAGLGVHRQPLLAARAWLSLVELNLRPQPDTPTTRRDEVARTEAELWFSYAAALIDERSSTALQAKLALAGAELALAQRDPELAVVRLNEAIALTELEADAVPDLRATLLRTRAKAHEYGGNRPAADQDLRAAAKLLARLLGPGHPVSR